MQPERERQRNWLRRCEPLCADVPGFQEEAGESMGPPGETQRQRFRWGKEERGMNELSGLHGSERYEAHDDAKQDKGVPPQAAPLQPLLPAVRAVLRGSRVTSFQRGKWPFDLTLRRSLGAVNGSPAPNAWAETFGGNRRIYTVKI